MSRNLLIKLLASLLIGMIATFLIGLVVKQDITYSSGQPYSCSVIDGDKITETSYGWPRHFTRSGVGVCVAAPNGILWSGLIIDVLVWSALSFGALTTVKKRQRK
jgi:hypothetical protein